VLVAAEHEAVGELCEQREPLGLDLAVGELKPEWLALFNEFPDRFVLGSDQHYPETSEPEQRWQEVVKLFNQLPPEVRRKIGTDNAARIYGKPVASHVHIARN